MQHNIRRVMFTTASSCQGEQQYEGIPKAPRPQARHGENSRLSLLEWGKVMAQPSNLQSCGRRQPILKQWLLAHAAVLKTPLEKDRAHKRCCLQDNAYAQPLFRLLRSVQCQDKRLESLAEQIARSLSVSEKQVQRHRSKTQNSIVIDFRQSLEYMMESKVSFGIRSGKRKGTRT